MSKYYQRKEKQLLWMSYTSYLAPMEYLCLLHLIRMTVLHFVKVREKTNWITVSKKKRKKKTGMNELYNVPCFNWIPLLSAFHIDNRASFSKSKRKTKLKNSVFKKRKKQLHWMSYRKTLWFNWIPLLSASHIDDMPLPPKRKRKTQFE